MRGKGARFRPFLEITCACKNDVVAVVVEVVIVEVDVVGVGLGVGVRGCRILPGSKPRLSLAVWGKIYLSYSPKS